MKKQLRRKNILSLLDILNLKLNNLTHKIVISEKLNKSNKHIFFLKRRFC